MDKPTVAITLPGCGLWRHNRVARAMLIHAWWFQLIQACERLRTRLISACGRLRVRLIQDCGTRLIRVLLIRA